MPLACVDRALPVVSVALTSLFLGCADPGGRPEPLFQAAPGSPIAVAGGPGNVALRDLDGDGKLDLVVACAKAKAVSVMLGQNDGRFRAAPGSSLRVPEVPTELLLRDLNGDGKLDMAIASHDSYAVTLLLGDGKSGFALAPKSPVVMKEGEHPHTHGLLAGDLNGDGHLDLVTVNSNPDNDVSVAFGDGMGKFTRAPAPFAVGASPYPGTFADLDGDGNPDIIATSTGRRTPEEEASSKALTVLFGDGKGGFRKARVPLRTALPWFVAVGDVNGDRKPDLVVTHAERPELTVLLGDGKGLFTEVAGSPFDLGHSAWYLSVADISRDGNADVVAAAGDGVRVLLGDGRGGFKAAPGSPFATGKGTWQLAVGDVKGDGKADVVATNLESDNVSVLLGR